MEFLNPNFIDWRLQFRYLGSSDFLQSHGADMAIDCIYDYIDDVIQQKYVTFTGTWVEI